MVTCLTYTQNPPWAQVPIPSPRIQGFAKQAALTWKESDSGRQESWNESGRQGLSAWPPPRGPSLSQQEEHELVHRAHWVRGQSCRNVPLASQWGTAIILPHSLPHSRPARALARVLSCHAQISEPLIMDTWVPALLLVLTSPGRPHGPQSPSLVEGMVDPASTPTPASWPGCHWEAVDAVHRK